MKMIKLSVQICFIIFIGLFVSGCGSLRQPTSFKKLSKSNMELITKQVEPSLEMSIAVYYSRFYSNKTVSYMVPAFPVFYSETLGMSVKPENSAPYCLASIFSVAPIIPLYYDLEVSIYATDGLADSNSGCLGMPIVFFYGYSTKELRHKQSKKFWEFGFIKLPYIGSFVGVGTDYLQIFWIPFCWPTNEPKLDYIYIGY